MNQFSVPFNTNTINPVAGCVPCFVPISALLTSTGSPVVSAGGVSNPTTNWTNTPVWVNGTPSSSFPVGSFTGFSTSPFGSAVPSQPWLSAPVSTPWGTPVTNWSTPVSSNWSSPWSSPVQTPVSSFWPTSQFSGQQGQTVLCVNTQGQPIGFTTINPFTGTPITQTASPFNAPVSSWTSPSSFYGSPVQPGFSPANNWGASPMTSPAGTSNSPFSTSTPNTTNGVHCGPNGPVGLAA